MTKRQIIIIVNILAVMLVASLLFLIWPRVQPRIQNQMPTPTPTAVIISSRDVSRGELVPVHFANLSFPVAGIVEEILVDEGDIVKTGDPLVKLNADEQESTLAQAQSRLAIAETELQAAETGLAAALSDVNTAELEVLAAEAQSSLVKAGASQQEVAAAEQNVEAARFGVVQASAGRDTSLEITDTEIRAAEANVATARAEVEKLQKTYDDIINTCFEGPEGDTICPLYGTVEENTRAKLEAARLNLSSAQAALDALNAGPTPGQRQAAAGAVAIALANQEFAEAQLNLLLAGPSQKEVQRAELRVAQARARVKQAQAAVERARAAISQAEVGVEIAQGELDSARIGLDRMTLQALFPGTVSQIDVKTGQLVNPGTPVLALADLGDWLVETTDLSEQNIARVEIGTPVEVTVEAISGETLAGEVINISRIFQMEGGEVIYQVTIDLEDRTDLPLRWGMSAEVDYGSGS